MLNGVRQPVNTDSQNIEFNILLVLGDYTQAAPSMMSQFWIQSCKRTFVRRLDPIVLRNHKVCCGIREGSADPSSI